jgi:hypothetical protein
MDTITNALPEDFVAKLNSSSLQALLESFTGEEGDFYANEFDVSGFRFVAHPEPEATEILRSPLVNHCINLVEGRDGKWYALFEEADANGICSIHIFPAEVCPPEFLSVVNELLGEEDDEEE